MSALQTIRHASREWLAAIVALLVCVGLGLALTARLRDEADRAALEGYEELEGLLVAQAAERVGTLLSNVDDALEAMATAAETQGEDQRLLNAPSLAQRGATFFWQRRDGQLLETAAGTDASLAHALGSHLHHVHPLDAREGNLGAFSACPICAENGMLTASRAVPGHPDLLVTAALDQGRVYAHVFAPLEGQHGAFVWLLRNDGLLLAGPRGSAIGEDALASTGSSSALGHLLARARRGERGTGSFSWDRDGSMGTRLAAFSPVPEHSELSVIYSADESSLLSRTWRVHKLGRALLLALGLLESVALLGLFLDARRRQRRAIERQRRRQEVQRLADFGRLVASVGHELRNPLTLTHLSIESAAEALDEPLDLDEARGAMDDAVIGVRQMRDVVATLGHLSRKQQPVGRLDMHELLSTAQLLAKPQLQRHQLEIDTASGLWVNVAAGEATQVILNLLVNATQAAGTEGRGGRISVHAGQEDGAVFVEVTDDGPGVAEAMRARLFEPFATSKKEGTGLGLSISREIAERHGGSLRLMDSSEGARFRFELPAVELETDAMGASVPSPAMC